MSDSGTRVLGYVVVRLPDRLPVAVGLMRFKWRSNWVNEAQLMSTSSAIQLYGLWLAKLDHRVHLSAISLIRYSPIAFSYSTCALCTCICCGRACMSVL